MAKKSRKKKPRKIQKKKKSRKKTKSRFAKVGDSGPCGPVVHSEKDMLGPGLDYGIRPRIMSMFNPQFVDLWYKAKCIAIGYTVVPQYGIYTDIPTISLGCENSTAMTKLFKLVKSWMQPPCDQSAIDICFVEDDRKGKYYLCISINAEQLIVRCFGLDAQNDYEVLVTTSGIAKDFKISEHYKRFKTLAHNTPILVSFGIMDKSCTQGTKTYDNMIILMSPQLDLAFVKDDIEFLTRTSLLPETWPYYLVNKPGKSRRELPPDFTRHTPKQVSEQRRKQLRRFFPVILARLSWNESFKDACVALKSNFCEWQIVQAACNIFARANWPEYGHGENADMIQIYQKLRNSTQDATEEAILSFEFAPEMLEEQIRFDMEYLHSSVCPNSKVDPQTELKSKGYL